MAGEGPWACCCACKCMHAVREDDILCGGCSDLWIRALAGDGRVRHVPDEGRYAASQFRRARLSG